MDGRCPFAGHVPNSNWSSFTAGARRVYCRGVLQRVAAEVVPGAAAEVPRVVPAQREVGRHAGLQERGFPDGAPQLAGVVVEAVGTYEAVQSDAPEGRLAAPREESANCRSYETDQYHGWARWAAPVEWDAPAGWAGPLVLEQPELPVAPAALDQTRGSDVPRA
jgi:hypothetical protein